MNMYPDTLVIFGYLFQNPCDQWSVKSLIPLYSFDIHYVYLLDQLDFHRLSVYYYDIVTVLISEKHIFV